MASLIGLDYYKYRKASSVKAVKRLSRVTSMCDSKQAIDGPSSTLPLSVFTPYYTCYYTMLNKAMTR